MPEIGGIADSERGTHPALIALFPKRERVRHKVRVPQYAMCRTCVARRAATDDVGAAFRWRDGVAFPRDDALVVASRSF